MIARNRVRGAGGRLAVLAVVVLLVAACTGSGGGADRQGQGPAGGQAQQQPRPPASVRGDLVGLVLSGGAITREGGAITLRFRLTNQGTDATTLSDMLGPGGLTVPPTSDASGVYLYDGAARKRFDVARDGGACRCAKVPPSLDPGASIELFATFPDVGQAVALSAIVPHFAPLDGLKIQN